MKNLVKGISLIAVLFGSSFAIAQQQQMQQRTPRERAQNQTRMMQKNLGLTDDQNKKVYDIILKYAQQADNARNEAPGRDRRQEMKEIQNNKEADLKAVLTGEQFQKYQAYQQEMKEKMQERRHMQRDGN